MELKPRHAKQISISIFLLIEPYGIETSIRWNNWHTFNKLLIEPYGIETADIA